MLRARFPSPLLTGLLPLLACMAFTGCTHRPVKVAASVPRSCPKYSYEVEHLTHCMRWDLKSNPPVCLQSESWDGKECMAYSPETGKPLGLFPKGGACNPYISLDCDEPDEATNTKKEKDDK